MMGPGRLPVSSLDRLADPPVELHPGWERKPLVDHLSHQRVGETVQADRARLLGHDPEVGGLRERAEDLLHREVAGGPEQRQVEGPAHHRRGRQHLDGVRGERGEPLVDHCPYALGNRNRDTTGAIEGFRAKRVNQLLHEQGIALGDVVDGRHPLLRRHPLREPLEQSSDPLAIQTPEGDRPALARQFRERLT
jgi:hypothetical protein